MGEFKLLTLSPKTEVHPLEVKSLWLIIKPPNFFLGAICNWWKLLSFAYNSKETLWSIWSISWVLSCRMRHPVSVDRILVHPVWLPRLLLIVNYPIAEPNENPSSNQLSVDWNTLSIEFYCWISKFSPFSPWEFLPFLQQFKVHHPQPKAKSLWPLGSRQLAVVLRGARWFSTGNLRWFSSWKCCALELEKYTWGTTGFEFRQRRWCTVVS